MKRIRLRSFPKSGARTEQPGAGPARRQRSSPKARLSGPSTGLRRYDLRSRTCFGADWEATPGLSTIAQSRGAGGSQAVTTGDRHQFRASCPSRLRCGEARCDVEGAACRKEPHSVPGDGVERARPGVGGRITRGKALALNLLTRGTRYSYVVRRRVLRLCAGWSHGGESAMPRSRSASG